MCTRANEGIRHPAKSGSGAGHNRRREVRTQGAVQEPGREQAVVDND